MPCVKVHLRFIGRITLEHPSTRAVTLLFQQNGGLFFRWGQTN